MQVAIKMQSHSSLSCDKRFMNSEANRRSTFQDWPHMDYKWLLPDTLAQAGFYHQPAQVGDDRTICFVCNLCLVAWEQSDQPWSEHERHSPICQFIRGEITENVSFSSTVATQPAVNVFVDEKEKVNFLFDWLAVGLRLIFDNWDSTVWVSDSFSCSKFNPLRNHTDKSTGLSFFLLEKQS
jgi:hypothetical protein